MHATLQSNLGSAGGSARITATTLPAPKTPFDRVMPDLIANYTGRGSMSLSVSSTLDPKSKGLRFTPPKGSRLAK